MIGKYALGSLTIGAVSVGMAIGPPDPPLTFNRSAPAAIARLAARERIVEGTGLGSLTLDGARLDEGAVRIRIARAGDAKTVRCRVAVHAVSPETSRAEVDCSQARAGDAMMEVGTQALTLIVREHVAATLEDRPYDVDRVADRMIALVVASRPAIAGELATQGQ